MRSLEHVRMILETEEIHFLEMKVKEADLPITDRAGRGLQGAFKATPEPLIRSWRVARRLMAATKPGDTVLASDSQGLGGVFSLLQHFRPSEEKRNLWTVAADSRYLELRVIASVHSGLPMPMDSVVDWEVVQYRFSDRILSTSERALIELGHIGVDAELAAGEPEAVAVLSREARTWWVPGPVSRRNQTGEVLRALTSVPGARATLSNADAADEIWSGDTWGALRHSREVLGDRVLRGDRPSDPPDVMVLGDALAPPAPSTNAYRADGVPVVVPTGSVASSMWPDAPQWTDADDLSRILGGGAATGPRPLPAPAPHLSVPLFSTASQVSVGVPVFRDVRFLDQCLESILSQTLAPIEVIIVDDGSSSTEVDDKLNEWARHDRRIRPIRTEHRGVCVARNRAMAEMTGDCFVFVDSDDYLDTDFLDKCATMLRGDDSLWAVATWTRFFGAYEGIEAKPPFDARVGRRENTIISTAALVDMEVRYRGIRFEPDLAFLFCEDWHLWSQIVAAGGRFGLVPEPLAHHRVHESSGGFLRTELAQSVGRIRATEPLSG